MTRHSPPGVIDAPKERIRSDRQKLVTMNGRMAALAKKGVPLEQVDQLKLADLGWDGAALEVTTVRTRTSGLS